MTKKIEVINGQEVEVTVCPTVLSPRELKLTQPPKTKRLVTQAERQARLAKRGERMQQALVMSAYDLSVQFGIEQRTLTESEALWEFSARNSLRKQKAKKPRLSDFDI